MSKIASPTNQTLLKLQKVCAYLTRKKLSFSTLDHGGLLIVDDETKKQYILTDLDGDEPSGDLPPTLDYKLVLRE